MLALSMLFIVPFLLGLPLILYPDLLISFERRERHLVWGSSGREIANITLRMTQRGLFTVDCPITVEVELLPFEANKVYFKNLKRIEFVIPGSSQHSTTGSTESVGNISLSPRALNGTGVISFSSVRTYWEYQIYVDGRLTWEAKQDDRYQTAIVTIENLSVRDTQRGRIQMIGASIVVAYSVAFVVALKG
jgi:hypothetical protein